jgi:uncharacterized protein (DUF924 family)
VRDNAHVENGVIAGILQVRAGRAAWLAGWREWRRVCAVGRPGGMLHRSAIMRSWEALPNSPRWPMNPQAVLTFWFDELAPKQHFTPDPQLDAAIRTRFAAVRATAARGELSGWRETPAGRLAEIIVLDQFSRNLFRGDARAFTTDGMALVLAQEAVRAAIDRSLPPMRRAFTYMPFMHSESPAIHVQAEHLFRQPGLENNYKFELKHKAIIDRFGRYPHRNAALGRTSTPEEEAFLKEPDSSF